MGQLKLAASAFIVVGAAMHLGCDKPAAPSASTSPPATAPAAPEAAAPERPRRLTREQNAENLRQIGQAMMMYSQTHPTTEPAATTQP
jgi:hypothetical protein